MSEYPSNSFLPKEPAKKQEERRHEAVTSGTVRVKKDSWIIRALHTFFAEDIHDLKSYLLKDVLLPAAQRTFLDLVKNGSEMAVHGKATPISSATNASKVSYTQYSNQQTVRTSRSVPSQRPSDPLFVDRGDAEQVLAAMREAIDRYGNVSILEMYDFANLTCDYTWSKYGWVDLSDAEVMRVQDDGDIVYMLRLPKAIPLN